MPGLQRRQPSADLRRAKMARDTAHPMVKSHSRSSSEDVMDYTPPKTLMIPGNRLGQLPVRYESDEESVSPCPDDFETTSAFSDSEIDSPTFFEADECPAIIEAKRMDMVHLRPMLVNISKLAPLEKRSRPAPMRATPQQPAEVAVKTSIGRTIVIRSVNSTDTFYQPTVVALSRPPMRFRPPPPVPPRSEARVAIPAEPATPKVPAYPPPAIPEYQEPVSRDQIPRKPLASHAPRPSVSTVGSLYDDTDDDRSSIADGSMISSAASSIADGTDLVERLVEARSPTAIEVRKNSHALREQQDAELRRAIDDYMMWRSEGSPGEPPDTVFKLSSEDRQMVRDQEEEEWRRELERGLTTPTPTSYAAYDPYGVSPPSLARPRTSFQAENVHGGQQVPARPRGFRNIVRRAI